MDTELQGATLTTSRPYPKCPATGCNEKITKSVQVLQEVLSHASFEVYSEAQKFRFDRKQMFRNQILY